MTKKDFFPPRPSTNPSIYAYELIGVNTHKGWIKIGFTDRNAKMRFGKTFASYQLAKKLGWKKLLVLTFKPAVQSAWDEDLMTHIDFEGWQFISRNGLTFKEADTTKPIVCFGSFQDFLGKKTSTGGIKTKNEWVHAIHWDCVIFDEYHYGTWRENAKELFEEEGKKELEYGEGQGIDYFDEEAMPITTNHYLYLSGTPFRAMILTPGKAIILTN